MKKEILSSLTKQFLFLVFMMCLFSLPVQVFAQDPCVNDTEPPGCTPPASVVLNGCYFSNFDPVYLQAQYGSATATDNCTATITNEIVILNGLGTIYDSICHKGTYRRVFVATDLAGNTTSCTQNITVNPNLGFSVDFPADEFDYCNNSDFSQPQVQSTGCQTMGMAYSDQVFTQGDTTRIERTWTIINWCQYNPNSGTVVIPRQDTNADGNTGDAFTLVYDGANMLYNSMVIASGTPDKSISYTQIIKCLSVEIRGTVFFDTNEDCDRDNGEIPLQGWKVRAESIPSGREVTVSTGSNGTIYNYIIRLDLALTDTAVRVYVLSSVNVGQTCISEYIYDLSNLSSNTVYVNDYPVYFNEDCPVLTVDIGSPDLTRCFNNYYFVSYANYGGVTATNAYVDVTLDPLISYVGSSIPQTSLGNNQYRFQLGNIATATQSGFSINVLVSCDATLGQLHCTEAHIYPDSTCDDMAWQGPIIVASATCDGDSVKLKLQNVGQEDMTQELEFLIVEDVIMYRNDPFQLDKNESLYFTMPANGNTWHLNAEQVIGNPLGSYTYATVEGCGTNAQGGFTTGVAGLFASSTTSFSIDTDCQPNGGSFDPNDKQAAPIGYGASHFMFPNTDLEYLIRFQNTGTDTAFTVVIEDKLSAHLARGSVRPGASSHPYSFSMDNTGIMRFRFDQIMLPDSTTNLAGSNGFVTYKVAQNPDLADNTVIENTAAIYFDYNEPVITNMTFHTIRRDFMTVKTIETTWPGASVHVFPNPAQDLIFFKVEGIDQSDWNLEIFDAMGRSVLNTNGKTGTLFPVTLNLPTGVYQWKIQSAGKGVSVGKLIKG